MTEQTADPAGDTNVSAPAQAGETAFIQQDIDRVLAAAKTVKLAIEVARQAPYTARDAELTPVEIFNNWNAVNKLLYMAFDNFYHEVYNTIEAMKLLLSRRGD